MIVQPRDKIHPNGRIESRRIVVYDLIRRQPETFIWVAEKSLHEYFVGIFGIEKAETLGRSFLRGTLLAVGWHRAKEALRRIFERIAETDILVYRPAFRHIGR